MMFAAHTQWPAMWLNFLLSRIASTASAFVVKRIAAFWRWVVMYYHILREWCGWMWPEEVLSDVSKSHLWQLCKKSNFHLLQNTSLEGDSTARTRLIDLTSCWLRLLLLPQLLSLLLLQALKDRLEAFNTLLVVTSRINCARLAPKSFQHSFWRSSRRCDVVFADITPL